MQNFFKLFLSISTFLCFSLVHAQVEPQPKKGTEPTPPVGTFVTPTTEQKESIQKPEKIEKKMAVTSDSSSDTPAANSAKAKSNEHLFGLHADLNIPHILGYGLDYWHSSRLFSISVNLGGYTENNLGKYNKDAEGASLKLSNQEAVLRYHPFMGAFYLGASYGQHKLSGSITRTMSAAGGSASADVKVDLTANYLTPHIGWMMVWDFGLSLGFDLGYLLPNNVKTDYSDRIYNITGPATETDVRNSADYQKARNDLDKGATDIGSQNIPYIALIRIGWMF